MTPAGRERWLGPAIFGLAFVVRLVYVWQSASGPAFDLPLVDAFRYDSQARALASGRGLDEGFFWQPLGYPLFLAVVYLASGPSIVAAKIVQALVGAATCALTYRLGRQVFDRRVGVLAGVITAVYGPLVFYDGELLSVGLETLWAVVLLLLLIRMREGVRPWLAAVTGLMGGLAVATRPTFLPFLVAAGGWVLMHAGRDGRRRMALVGGLLLAGFGVVAAPVAVANYRANGSASLFPSSGGLNLFIGNNPDACATLTARPGWEWERLTRLPLAHGAPSTWGPAASAVFFDQVRQYAAGRPGEFLVGLGRKTLEVWSAREMPRNTDIYLFRPWSGVLAALVWKAGPFGFPFGVLFPLAVVGLVSRWRRLPAPLWFFLALYPASIALVFVADRYRLPLIPALAVLAGAGVVGLVHLARRREAFGLVVTTLVGGAAVLVSILPGPACQERVEYRGELYRILGSTAHARGRTEQATALFAEALRIDPGSAETHADFAALLRNRGRLDEARSHLVEALRLRPDAAEVHRALGLVAFDRGSADEAIRRLSDAARLDPGDPRIENDLGVVSARRGAAADAVVHFERAIAIMPHYAEARNNLGISLAGLGRLLEARAQFGEAVRIQPHNAGARHNLGQALLRLGDPEGAAAQFREALRVVPGDAASQRGLQKALDVRRRGSP